MVNKNQPQFQTPQHLHQEESDEELSESVTESPAHLTIRPGSALSEGYLFTSKNSWLQTLKQTVVSQLSA